MRRPTLLAICLLITVLIVITTHPASQARAEAAVALYVAADGNDAWSGRLPTHNADNSDGPFATLQRASDAIRQLKQSGPLPRGGVLVEVAGGIYELAQPLELVQQDSRTDEAPIVARNICWGRKWDEVEAKAKPGVTFIDNLTDQVSHFADAEHLNFRLREESPAWKLGFQRIPIEKIGLYPSDDRASWPVHHKVRPKPSVTAP